MAVHLTHRPKESALPILVTVLLIATSSVFGAQCRGSMGSRSLDSPYARQFNEAYQKFRREGDRSARLARLSQMIHLHRDVVEMKYLGRSFTARLKNAKIGLFPFLFDADEGVRWAVAYAIGCFEGEPLPAPKADFAKSRTVPNESMVKRALEVYLPRHQHLPFVYVSPTRVDSVRRMVEVRVEVTNELHLDLSVGRPRLAIPDWVTKAPQLSLHLTSADRKFSATQSGTGQRTADHCAATQSFQIDPWNYVGALYLEIRLDGREVDRKVLTDGLMAP